MEKNWKKLISRRHVRLEGDAAAAQTHESSGHPQDESTLSTSDSAIAAESKPSEDAPDASSDGALLADKQNEQVVQTESPAKSADVNGANATSEHGNGARRVKSEKQQPDDETMALAKRQLEVSLFFRDRFLACTTNDAYVLRCAVVLVFLVGVGGEIEDAGGSKARKVLAIEEHSRRRSALQERHHHHRHYYKHECCDSHNDNDSNRCCKSSPSSSSSKKATCRV